MKAKHSFFLFIVVLFGINAQAQQKDTVLIDKLIEQCKQSELYSSDSALYYAGKALSISQKIKDSVRIAIVYRRMGNVYLNIGNIHTAEIYQNLSLKICENISYKAGIAACLSNIANIKTAQSLNNEAIDYYQKALLLFLELKDRKGYARALGNIGLLCQQVKEYKKAISYQLKSYTIRKEIHDTFGLALASGNLGSLYGVLKKYDSCFYYLDEALLYNTKINSLQGLAILYGNYGSFLIEKNLTERADRMLLKAYRLSIELNELSNKGNVALSLGQVNISKKNYMLASQYLDTSIAISFRINEVSLRAKSYKVKSELYKEMSKPAEALHYFEMHYALNDSILGDETKSGFEQRELQLQHEQQKLQQKLEQEKKDAIANEKIKQQKLIQYFLFSIVLGFVFLSLYIYRNFKHKRSANLVLQSKNEEIETQKFLLEEKNKEVIDSMRYARRIQKVLLASDKLISHYVPDYFILNKPKDIVSGDFYWASSVETTGQSNFLFATCDCTGHGVPGAFMSLLNISFLNECVLQKKIFDPAGILEETRKNIISALNRDSDEPEAKDGMDAVLLNLDLNTLMLEFVAANNPLILIRNNEMIKFTPDKFPVGLSHGYLKPFTLQKVQVQKGDCIYSFTDGFADQFGGIKGKKFKQKNLEQLLQQVCSLPMKLQLETLNNEFIKWQGNLEQVDDVLIVGMKI